MFCVCDDVVASADGIFGDIWSTMCACLVATNLQRNKKQHFIILANRGDEHKRKMRELEFFFPFIDRVELMDFCIPIVFGLWALGVLVMNSNNSISTCNLSLGTYQTSVMSHTTFMHIRH